MLLATHLRGPFPAAASCRSAMAARPAVACRRSAAPSVARPPPITYQAAPAPLLPASCKPANRTKVFSSTSDESRTHMAQLKQRGRLLKAAGGRRVYEMKVLAEQLAELLVLKPFTDMQLMAAELLALKPERMKSLVHMMEEVLGGRYASDGDGNCGATDDDAGTDYTDSERAWRRFVNAAYAALATLRKGTDGKGKGILTLQRSIVKDMVRALYARIYPRITLGAVDKMGQEELWVLQSAMLGDFLAAIPELKTVITGEDEGEDEDEDEVWDEGEGEGSGTQDWQAVLRLTASGSLELARALARSYLPLAPPQYRALALVLMLLSDSKGGGVDGLLTLKQMHALIKELDPSIKHLPKIKSDAVLLLARLVADYIMKDNDDDNN
ncbi:hypothetical protein HXX76_011078 [Chlamydomonas incerta]|uniref:Uncharacterized protein n=1 Tax=Chlamydomonas incerta TaxID=51695 RepID=A0A835VVE0_CHLIN|nr:hypothetical protein HXX76_011078 [Chlamydomonas incerta]|eukprot:KAG2429310.1 hypothetical protein HXX76_011078 [Chlamydomonas incerta]